MATKKLILIWMRKCVICNVRHRVSQPTQCDIEKRLNIVGITTILKPKMNQVADIIELTKKSTRHGNDTANRKREAIIPLLASPPEDYLTHLEYGHLWREESQKWNEFLSSEALKRGYAEYNRVTVRPKGGRGNHYDFDIDYFTNDILLGNVKTEYKFGGKTIESLPQFYSLSVKKCDMFAESYSAYYYNHFIDKYIECDKGLPNKPSFDDYMKYVHQEKYERLSFFATLKEREHENQKEKANVVNESIKKYWEEYGRKMDFVAFQRKIETQKDKLFVLYENGQYYTDMFRENELSGELTVSDKIINNNILEVKRGNSAFHLLLRWRNHKGILNPAWQIKLVRNVAEKEAALRAQQAKKAEKERLQEVRKAATAAKKAATAAKKKAIAAKKAEAAAKKASMI